MLNRDKFGNAFTSEGGIKPSIEVLNKIGKISDLINGGSELNDIILNTMDKFLHNRVGTAISESEYEKGIANTRPIDNPIRGKMYAFHTGPGNAHVWVIYIGEDDDSNYKVKIRVNLTDNSSDITTRIIPAGSLFEYQSLEPIEQKYKSTEPKLGEDELLETYRIE